MYVARVAQSIAYSPTTQHHDLTLRTTQTVLQNKGKTYTYNYSYFGDGRERSVSAVGDDNGNSVSTYDANKVRSRVDLGQGNGQTRPEYKTFVSRGSPDLPPLHLRRRQFHGPIAQQNPVYNRRRKSANLRKPPFYHLPLAGIAHHVDALYPHRIRPPLARPRSQGAITLLGRARRSLYTTETSHRHIRPGGPLRLH